MPTYLDHAATSWPKAPGLAGAVADAVDLPAAPWRGAHAHARRADAIIADCRRRLAALIGADDPDRVILTAGLTDGVNLTARGVVSARRRARPDRGVHLVSTGVDHNVIGRLVAELAADPQTGVTHTRVPVSSGTGLVDPADLAAAITPDTALVLLVHASNVAGTLQDLGALTAVARERGVPVLVDSAQSLGHLPVDAPALGVDILVAAGHKGLHGPLGTGFVWVAPGVEDLIDPMRVGGTGTDSATPLQPRDMPTRFEAGTPNLPGIAGLAHAAGWVAERGLDAIRAHELALIERVLGLAERTPGVRLLGPTDPAIRTGVFSFVVDGLDPVEASTILELEFGVITRAGLHCAPSVHRTFGSLGLGGTVRASLGATNTAADVDRLFEAFSALTAEVGAGRA